MINYINYEMVFRPRKEMPPGRYRRMIRRWADNAIRHVAGMRGYDVPSLRCEFEVVRNSFLKRRLVHFFNGDTNCKLFPYLKHGNRVIATYHQPPDFFYKFFRRCSHIKRLDAAVVTSNVLADLLGAYLSADRIFHVPLAVDREFFRPSEKSVGDREGHICLLVGNWLRDFETMREVIKLFRERKDVQFRIVTLKWNKKYFEGLENTTFLYGLREDDYMSELHGADLLVVPLKSGTSNLTFLEAMACGLPIVTTDVGGIRDYLDETFAVMLKRGDHRAIAAAIDSLLKDEARREEMSRKARLHSRHFSWDVISDRLRKVYSKMGASIG